MKKFFKKLWAKISGYKTLIGVSGHIVWFLANVIKKDLSSPSETVIGHSLIFTITGVGIGHKISKSGKIQKNIENVNKKSDTKSNGKQV
jgi:hypothetical protein